jgi:hypothetical protein
MKPTDFGVTALAKQQPRLQLIARTLGSQGLGGGEMEYGREIDPNLAGISDTSVLLNFADALVSLYPHMKAVHAHCYDPYDDVVEPLFWALVYGTLADKYGVTIQPGECQQYEFAVGPRRCVNYIRVRPQKLPIVARTDSGAEVELNEQSIAAKELIFVKFGDGTRSLTGPEDPNDRYEDVSFHLTMVQLVPERAADLSRCAAEHFWLLNNALVYEFVHDGIVLGAA